MAYNNEFGENPRHPTGLLTSMTYLLLASNNIGTILRAYSSGNNWFLAFIFFIYLCFFLLECCYSAYHRLPRGQKSARKNFLAVAIWCLFSGVIFGFTYQFATHFSLVTAVPTYAVAFAASATIFYVYIIRDGGEKCDEYDNCCHGYTTGDSKIKFTGGHVEIIFEKV